MIRSPWLFPLLGLGAVLAFPGEAAAGSDDIKVEAPLVRPSPAPDGDAKGKVRVERDTKKNRDRLKVEAEHIDNSLTFELYVEDAMGQMVLAGSMPPNGPGEVEIEFDTKEGPPLPAGASSVDELAGRRVEVRSGGSVYLFGTIPDIAQGGAGGGSGGGGSWQKVKSPMIRPAGAPDPDAKGYVEVRFRAKDQRHRFKVEAEHVDPSIGFFVYLENAAGSGVLENVGAMVQEDSDEVELELDTGDGAQLPFGVSTVDELAGREVQVRDAQGQVYLTGVVPALGGQKKAKASAPLSATVGKGEVRLKRSLKKDAKEVLEIRLKKLPKKTTVQIWMAPPGGGPFELVATLQASGGGGAKFKINTKKGTPLPLGALTLDDLAGAAVEVRDPNTGGVLQNGSIPSL